MKENIKKILIEIPTIVVGVLIALAVNEWSVERERNKLKENVLTAIREELVYNRTTVQSAYDYHVPLLDELLKNKHKIFFVPMKEANLSTVTANTIRSFLFDLTEKYGKSLDQAMTVKQKSPNSFIATVKEDILRIIIENDTLKIYGEGNISLRPAYIRNDAWKVAQAAQIAPFMDFKIIGVLSELDRTHTTYAATNEAIVKMLYEGQGHIVPALQDVVYFEEAMLKKYNELDLLLRDR